MTDRGQEHFAEVVAIAPTLDGSHEIEFATREWMHRQPAIPEGKDGIVIEVALPAGALATKEANAA